ncbi:hypothetical protein IQ10_03413 [Halalkalibacter nanhaiisediminis]|uniref:Uncharacterized protein n=1 Tax=Halalkalibacter nanhaiisediminis TaxID=688079 RepID=A0A562Q987_9BACI|nr:hypothetical protein IQ10_03413 [Halalkalibacter nanhaiisediminis]
MNYDLTSYVSFTMLLEKLTKKMEATRMSEVLVVCPMCRSEQPITNLLTAQSNQNVIYTCPTCQYEKRNIPTKKG